MAKKKNQSKKHKFKYSEPTSELAAREPERSGGVTSESTAAKRPAVAVTATTHDYSYVFTDLRRIGLLVGSLVLLELVLWYLLGHTGLGDAVHNLIKL